MPADQITTTRVVGFARWMERGAKPEFFGLTTLRCAADELVLATLLSDERLYSTDTRRIPVDLAALRENLVAGVGLLDAPNLPAPVRDQGALPCYSP